MFGRTNIRPVKNGLKGFRGCLLLGSLILSGNYKHQMYPSCPHFSWQYICFVLLVFSAEDVYYKVVVHPFLAIRSIVRCMQCGSMTHSLRLTPDEDYASKALVFLIALYVSSYRWVHFSRAVLFCQPHQQLFSFLGNHQSCNYCLFLCKTYFLWLVVILILYIAFTVLVLFFLFFFDFFFFFRFWLSSSCWCW